ncbi:response regulator transcription factor [Stenotrophomonas sp. SY1]|jgi:two-component system capsular synthesis response regulator RcsB|uniref:response regulator transcription factor n=1 Tax=Stenotrophomonas sp. SY1 TaxID=477235 RepID=UPI001E399D8D|nr:response regulator transcription factor [Stenotrophomonas sp. SY1]MCD9086087.1 response regulator transcription factor [Stenotrophomonas sp. SY1]
MSTTVVIADDHPIVLAGIRELIAGDPRFELVGQAQSPSALVELTRALAPDIVISDYNMPGNDPHGDGIKLISHLHRHFPDSKVLILTMISNPSIIGAMYRAGASGVVRKSGDLKELSIALSTLLNHRIHCPPGWNGRVHPLHGGSTSPSLSRLSPREFEVIRLFVNGQNVRDIAKHLNRSSKTVSTQKVSAMRKLGTQSDQELISFCLESDLFR